MISIPWQLGAAMMAFQVVGMVSSYMGSVAQAKRLKRAAEWDKYKIDLAKKQEVIKQNKQAKMLLSEKLAAIGARGVVAGTGSTLLETQSVFEELDDARFWLEKGVQTELMETDYELGSALAQNAWERNTSLIEGVANVGMTAYMSYDSFKGSFGGNKIAPITGNLRPSSFGTPGMNFGGGNEVMGYK